MRHAHALSGIHAARVLQAGLLVILIVIALPPSAARGGVRLGAVHGLMVLSTLVSANQQLPRVVVIARRNRRGIVARSRLESALTASGLEVLAAPMFAGPAQEMGLRRSEMTHPDAVAKISQRVPIDGVVVCRIARKGRRRSLSIELLDATGKLQLATVLPVGRWGLSRFQAQRAADEIHGVLPGKGGGVRAKSAAKSTQPKPSPPPADATAIAVPKSPPTTHMSMSAYAPQTKKAANARPLIGVRLIGGMGTTKLRARSTSGADNANSGRQWHRFSAHRPYLDYGVMLETHPFRDLGLFAEGLGAELRLTRGNSYTGVDSESPLPFEARVTRLHADARYELQLSSGRLEATIAARGGWFVSQFETSRVTDHLVPVTHTGLRGGAELRIPLKKGYADLQLWGYYTPLIRAKVPKKYSFGKQILGFGYGGRIALLGGTTGNASGITWGLWAEADILRDEFRNVTSRVKTTSETRYYAAAATLGVAY